MKKEGIVNNIEVLVFPITQRLGYELYHVEFVKENGENYLRIYIDSEDGINLDDCEKVSREVSEMLDVEDPITDSYYLEVSSPGIERELHTDAHLEKYIDNSITIRLASAFNGKKKLEGTLKSFTDEDITLLDKNKEIVIPRDKVSKVNLRVEF
ncbi:MULTISPECIES: ribosome maturation factor RimP [unclassified Clostridium]|uniref:ribosome maturation factor RimP n=1 Tax=unclassified Clostridium TaxID=2614128 RepID=UPI00052D41FD|nr:MULTISPECIES: ribosome maturation factor RimP [unclassified Clostridium]KGK88505.1 ribosome maturation protein RimP [Clostridium sp. HMP27]MBE6068220.1 ribosome maturation factor RimP [Clostridium lundense]